MNDLQIKITICSELAGELESVIEKGSKDTLEEKIILLETSYKERDLDNIDSYWIDLEFIKGSKNNFNELEIWNEG